MTRSVFREKEYFDEYISAKIRTFEKQQLKIQEGELSGNKLAYAKKDQLYNLYHQLVAKYSRGDKIIELKPIFEKIVDGLTGEKWEENFVKFTYPKHKKVIVTNQLSLDFHNLMLNILSIGVLINGDIIYFTSLSKFLEFYNIEYKLFDIFLNFKIKNHSIKESKYSLKQYKKLEDLINSKKITTDNLSTYHNKWFQSLSPSYFNIMSTTKNGMFDGYWCFESAALARINLLNIEQLFDNVYFPTDLFNNDETFFKYQISLEIKLLNSIDKTMRDVGKNWGIRNPSNEILISRRILQRYNKKRYTELEEQIGSYFKLLENSALSKNKEQILLNKPIVITNLINLLKHYKIEFSVLESKLQSNNNSDKTISFWFKLKNIWSSS
ncbi:PoNe immunity protein domain-containing protein [Aestuariibaculum marinum]|uniref:DUF1911 domain-containing protein n=1 Tax=Aestuariibaculum marinum TaxID=2683592 RepID=A0A8J6U4Y4_9FLAO|nr:PoNe immunity protein domain-containing protein [Aestuariibaculum marinum]MBD0823319.1 DUF1911 domain-containing protein [Aestuariibaculum marinum]